MNIGASTKSFGGLSVAETAELFAKSGLDCAELCFCQRDLSGWKYNLCGKQPLPDTDRVYEAIKTFRSLGISVSSLGLYNCLWAGSTENMLDSFYYFTEFCDMAKDVGVEVISTHTGTPGVGLYGLKLPENLKERAAEMFMYPLFEAWKRGITVAVETSANDALCGYGEYTLLKSRAAEQLGTDKMLKYIGVPSAENTVEIREDTGLFHIKDISRDGDFYCCFGSGAGDFGSFFRNISGYSGIPMIFEYVNSSNLAKVCRDFRARLI